ncbi:hypothetical protein IAR55_003671 [Kwoniella newhampshirensis]|uniref:WIBG Mago-binding domain-containing protein n=1 Tax=Kwoniella newhampshirensis TaxID=1651941 RepID=A0AAW0YZ14_9TREE
MSLPPLNPNKTAAGIIVDPRTLERVVPQSRRSDGTVRKERKIRPGFTPQEDVGLFRPKAVARASAISTAVPGSNRPAPPLAAKADNPFAQEALKEKTKAQLKNERRREKKREKASVNWDEEQDDEDADDDEMKEAFEKVDKERQWAGVDAGADAGAGSENAFPPLQQGDGGVPGKSVVDEVKAEDEKVNSQTELLTPPPPGPGPEIKAPAPTSTTTEPPSATITNGTPTPTAASIISDRKAEIKARPQQNPHPIQGGRKGPIGLAHPPPIEAEKPKPPPPQTRADSSDSWRPARKSQPQARSQKSSRAVQNGGGQPQSQAKSQLQSTRSRQSKPPPGSATAPPDTESKAPPAPRERREVRVRQGGANDVSSLANRVKNLVIASAVGNGTPREKKTGTPKTET